jgi:hypothetical protein
MNLTKALMAKHCPTFKIMVTKIQQSKMESRRANIAQNTHIKLKKPSLIKDLLLICKCRFV